MLTALRSHPLLRRLWMASTVSLVGDWLSFVAVSLLSLDHGGGPLALVGVLAVHSLPRALLAPIAGSVADRFDRRRLLVLASLTQAALTVAMALAAWRAEVALVQALVLARSAVSAFMVPAEAAAIRRVVPEADLVRANLLLSSTWSVTYVAGMALGGVIATLGPTLAILLDASTFLVAALLFLGLPRMRPQGGAPPAPGLTALIRGLPRDLRGALRHAQARPDLFRAVFAKAPVAVGAGAGWLTLNLVAGRLGPFGSTGLSIGILQALRGAGICAGPFVVDAFVRRGRSSTFALHLATALLFVGVALFPLTTSAPLLVVLALVWGMGSGANWVLTTADIQRFSSDRFIGRLASIDDLATTVGQVGGALVGALVAELTGGVAGGAWAGIALGLVGWAWLMRRPRGGKAHLIRESIGMS